MFGLSGMGGGTSFSQVPGIRAAHLQAKFPTIHAPKPISETITPSIAKAAPLKNIAPKFRRLGFHRREIL